MDIWNFADVRWGQDEAKGDDDLLEYFVPVPEFESIKTGDIRYVIGRKGTGKTAIVERIRLEAENSPLAFYSTLSLRDFPLGDFRDLRDRSFRDKSQFVSIWLFLIYVELAKIVLDDNGAESITEVEDIRKFLDINGLANSIGFAETVTLLKSNSSKVKVLSQWVEGERDSAESTTREVHIHYKKVVDVLRALICKVASDSEYWLFMDELDEGYRAGDQSLRLILLALLRAVEDSALALQGAHIRYRPLLVLRSDIYDGLEDNDLNKLDDHLVRLRWTSKDDETEYALKNIPVARIRASIALPREVDPWLAIVKDLDPELPERVDSIWQYMANRTYERPRDIIKFLKHCRKQNTGGPLTFAQVKAAEDGYSGWLYNEIRDEIHSYLPVWKEALQCLTRIGSGKLTLKDYVVQLQNDTGVSRWLTENSKDPEEIVQTLFEFGVIGNLDGKRWLFKYKDHDLAWNPSMDLIVHFGLNKKLRLFKR